MVPQFQVEDYSFHVVQGALVISLFFQVVSHIFQKAKAAYTQQRELGARGKGLKPQAFTLVSKFQQSLQDLTAKLRRWKTLMVPLLHPEVCEVFSGQHRKKDDQRFFLLFYRSHAFFIRCITPNPKKVGQHSELLMESLSSLKFSPLQQLSFHSWGLGFFALFDSLKLFFPFLCLSPLPVAMWPEHMLEDKKPVSVGHKGCVGFCVPLLIEHGKI